MHQKTGLNYVKVWFLHVDGSLMTHDVQAETRSEGESKVLTFYGDDILKVAGSMEYWVWSMIVRSV